jgi:hypothetical protein
MRYLLLICLLPVLSLCAADVTTDEADYEAYQARQKTIREAVAVLDALLAEKHVLRNVVDDVKDRFRGVTAEQAMAAWRVQVRAITDRDAKWAAYGPLREADALISGLKARYGTNTIVATLGALNDAIDAAQAAVQAARAE